VPPSPTTKHPSTTHHQHLNITTTIHSISYDPAYARMDALVARYASAHDDFFDEDSEVARQQLNTKPTHDHQFSLPPIAQVIHLSGSYLCISGADPDSHLRSSAQ